MKLRLSLAKCQPIPSKWYYDGVKNHLIQVVPMVKEVLACMPNSSSMVVELPRILYAPLEPSCKVGDLLLLQPEIHKIGDDEMFCVVSVTEVRTYPGVTVFIYTLSTEEPEPSMRVEQRVEEVNEGELMSNLLKGAY